MWSTPVHRWLFAHVHLPTMKLARSWTTRGSSKGSTMTTWLPAVVATCVVSGAYHEAVVYVAMRGTCWPFNTFLLCVAGVLLLTWDVLFPARSKAENNHSPGVKPSAATVAAGSDTGSREDKQEGDHDGGKSANAASSATAVGGREVKRVRVYGERGMVSVIMFNILIQLSAFIADGAAWLWWRHLHVKN